MQSSTSRVPAPALDAHALLVEAAALVALTRLRAGLPVVPPPAQASWVEVKP